MRKRAFALFVIGGLALALAFAPQLAAHAVPDISPSQTPSPETVTPTAALACQARAAFGAADSGPTPPPKPAAKLPLIALLLGGGGLLGGLVFGRLAKRSSTHTDTSGGIDPALPLQGSQTGPGGIDLSNLTVEDAVQLMMMLLSHDDRDDLRSALDQMESDRKRRRAEQALAADALGSESDMMKKLQGAMDHESKFLNALSNALKKEQDTADGFLKNIK